MNQEGYTGTKLEDTDRMENDQLTLIDVIEEMSVGKDVCLRPMRIAQDIMNADVKTLTLDHTVRQCRQFMEDHRVRHAPVVDTPYGKEKKARFIGVVSERDVLRVNAPDVKITDKEKADKRALRQLLAQIVARKPKSVSPQTPVKDVITTMDSNHIDMVPVVQDGDVVGVVTTTDLLKLFVEIDKVVRAFFPESGEGGLPAETGSESSAKTESLLSWISQTAQEIMSTELIYLKPKDTLAMAIEVMQDAEIRHLLVIADQGDLVGLVSDRNILQNLPYVARRPPSPPKKFREHLFLTNSSAKCLELPLEQIMKRNVLHVTPVLTKKISCLPILDDNDNPLGMITVTDLMRTLLAIYDPINKSTASQTEPAPIRS